MYDTNKNKSPWPQQPTRIQELFRAGAETVLAAPSEWWDELDKATLNVLGSNVTDPVLIATTRKTNRINVLHWATANIKSPCAPVEPDLGPEILNAARDLVRRGATETSLHAYRAGQNAAWRRWMDIAFELTDNPEELQALLQISSKSIEYFVNATITTLAEHMASERDELLRGTQAEHREIINLILNHAPITRQVASQRLGYRLDQLHRALIIWEEEAISESTSLDEVVEIIIQAAGSPRALKVITDGSTRWVWLPGEQLDIEILEQHIDEQSPVRIAIGAPGNGMEGFRKSHLDARTAQSVLVRSEVSDRIVSYDRVRLIALLTKDTSRIKRYINETLGELLTADPILQVSVRSFLETGCNAARAAQVLGLHRNTLLRHISRAEELLPQPLDECRIQVAMALEVLRWMPAKY